eukprot:RCo008534
MSSPTATAAAVVVAAVAAEEQCGDELDQAIARAGPQLAGEIRALHPAAAATTATTTAPANSEGGDDGGDSDGSEGSEDSDDSDESDDRQEPQEDSEEKAKLVEVFLEIQAAAADALTQLCQQNLKQKKEATGSSNSTTRAEAHQMAFKAVVRVLSAVHLG